MREKTIPTGRVSASGHARTHSFRQNDGHEGTNRTQLLGALTPGTVLLL